MHDVKIAAPGNLSPRGRLGFLLRDTVVYGGAAAITKAFALLTFPLLARHFSVADYGTLDYFVVLANFLATVLIFGQDSAVARYFYEHEDMRERRQLISQSLLLQMVQVVLLVPLLWFSAAWASKFLIEQPNSVRFFRIALLQLPFLLLISFAQNLLKWTFARTAFLSMSLGFTIVQATLLVTAVIAFQVGIEGILLANLATSCVFGMLGLFHVRRWLTWPQNFRRMREMLPFALPYGIIGVLAAFSPTLERSLTNGMLGPEALGLYAAGVKIAMLIGLVVSAFQTAWGPFSLSIHKERDAVETYNGVLKLFALGVCVAVLVLTLCARLLIQVLASARYEGALIVVFPLAMGLAIQATSWITEIGIGISKRSYLNLYAYCIALAATLSAILLLTPTLGLVGVAWGVMIGQTLKAITSSWLAQRAYRQAWHYVPVLVVISLTLVVGIAATLVLTYWTAAMYDVVLIAGLLVVVCVGWTILPTASQRRRVIEFARERRPFRPHSR